MMMTSKTEVAAFPIPSNCPRSSWSELCSSTFNLVNSLPALRSCQLLSTSVSAWTAQLTKSPSPILSRISLILHNSCNFYQSDRNATSASPPSSSRDPFPNRQTTTDSLLEYHTFDSYRFGTTKPWICFSFRYEILSTFPRDQGCDFFR
jgi:hypothetical protein